MRWIKRRVRNWHYTIQMSVVYANNYFCLFQLSHHPIASLLFHFHFHFPHSFSEQPFPIYPLSYYHCIEPLKNIKFPCKIFCLKEKPVWNQRQKVKIFYFTKVGILDSVMARNQEKWRAYRPLYIVVFNFLLASVIVSAERSLKLEALSNNANGISNPDSEPDESTNLMNFLWQANKSGYKHVWPVSQIIDSVHFYLQFLNYFLVFPFRALHGRFFNLRIYCPSFAVPGFIWKLFMGISTD